MKSETLVYNHKRQGDKDKDEKKDGRVIMDVILKGDKEILVFTVCLTLKFSKCLN